MSSFINPELLIRLATRYIFSYLHELQVRTIIGLQKYFIFFYFQYFIVTILKINAKFLNFTP
jgi:hypothetical protein